MNAAAMARQNKMRRPTDYCASPDCLFRVQSRTGYTPCPKHPPKVAYYCMACPEVFYDAKTSNAHHDTTGHHQHWKQEQSFAARQAETVALPTAPFPGYDVRAMTYHGGSVDAETRVDDRQHIANDREEARELMECEEDE